MDRSPFGATPRLRRRRAKSGRRVSVSPRILASGTGDVWTAAAHLSLGGPVRDRCEDLNACVAHADTPGSDARWRCARAQPLASSLNLRSAAVHERRLWRR